MMYRLLRRIIANAPELTYSQLYTEDTFYKAFMKDMEHCRSELIIESAFTTSKRVDMLLPTIKHLKKKGVRVVVNTRNPEESDNCMRADSRKAIALLQYEGVQVIFTENQHRKIAVLDRDILWEGSLNILSQNQSKEVMRRTESPKLAQDIIRFTKIDTLMN